LLSEVLGGGGGVSKILRKTGAAYDQSSQWQALADIPAKEFDQALAAQTMPSTEGIINAWRLKQNSNPFSLSFITLSLGLFADDSSQSRTLAMLTVWVTLGVLASTSIRLAGPGAQPCSRKARTASATAS